MRERREGRAHVTSARVSLKGTRAGRSVPLGTTPEHQQLAAILAGDDLAWRKFVADYGEKLRAVVRHATEAAGSLTEDQIDDVLGDFWVAALANNKRMLRAFDPKRGSDLLTWLTFHVAQIAHECVHQAKRQPEMVPLDEVRHVPDLRHAPPPKLRGEGASGTIDAAIRECVRSTVLSVVREELTTANHQRKTADADRPRPAAWWAEQLGCSAESLVKRAKRGTLTPTKIGCRFYFTKAQIEGSRRWQHTGQRAGARA
jgi:DNA-directed RNA polymerase specialized sigma24 family protein